MDESKRLLLKNYFSNIQVNLRVADFTHCKPSWNEMAYTPEYNKFYFVCEGEGWVKIGDKEFFPKPGQLFLMPEGVVQSYSAISKNTFVKYWCHFNAYIGEMNLFDVIQLPYHIDVQDRQRLEKLFKELILHYQSTELTSSLKVKSTLLEIISFFIDNTVVEKIHISTSSSIEKLNYILSYIDKHLSENITIEELSKIVHFHPNYFIKFFKTRLGVSPKHYINKMRLEKAKQLIKTTDMPITEIGNLVGFGDLFYFSKVFKSFTGFSPSDFRSLIL